MTLVPAVAVAVPGALDDVLAGAGLVGVAHGALGTFASEGADRVFAYGTVPAAIGRGALVDVDAGLAVGAHVEARQAAAEGFAALHEALGVREACRRVAGI